MSGPGQFSKCCNSKQALIYLELQPRSVRAYVRPRKIPTFSEAVQWRQARARAWASGNKLTPQKANSRRKNVRRCFRTALWPISPRPSMACSFFGPQSQADAVQWWHRSSGVGPTDGHCPGGTYQKAIVAMQLPRFRPTAPDMALAPQCRLPLRISGIYASDSPPSGSGSCQRGRGRGMHRPCSGRSCSEIPGISWRVGMRAVAHLAILTWPAPPPPPPFPLKQHKCWPWR
jgi:hypothetical protein